ncbi:sigma-70 family rna polymerase sigma factor : RNA polymerase sigma factor, sigma-70 family OS=Singulisphaera acidiphila (strain ATCC BAA-1392 / DSM 18658 / VKM B-2454 / MOB10) GN=Sinac_7487 PE=4 SV=1: Sigma70_r2: Sigma70_r4_2 [Gemmata massiliana]|uniref:ECF RNA polymerase sigma factor SigE n=1 Tax=Gemmata massiliana TaxID=1210884 RepID=A0A6P2D2I7_9BACT|nr:sigma-70 family RNA polymerase sigma factor [Gemmata massiliana]VTR95349.1 sigma-70 family rna polymerase sigma factor : RNA polymerase sigma factor, sigma-70 family OS=Singulisphaera acidiphila (strain ATCC BAA-1392 / DSM 18658 / VKM B-2454 / MOB10) GN=Sinac_7487 PE=4 SV=1: Sigma70_r2: Sigma70_r4_2 [Gemmata massiliana]
MNRLRTGPLPVVQLRDALRSDLDALPDAELLDRFARYADHPAFEVLLRRHGPMVFGVCRRTLTNVSDAEDAFQATFLVFIRKARSLRRADRLGPWLYGVACRVAMKARARAARLAEYRTEVREMFSDSNAPAAVPDWLPVLDTELAALPAKYRDALVMCELEGASRADAAKALGVPEGTLSSRLARGRELLRRRLLKHGTLLPTSGLVALFTTNGVGRAVVPAALLARTSELAATATSAANGAVPVGAAQLTDEVLKSMFLTKLRGVGAAVLALTLMATGLAAAWAGEEPRAAAEDKSIGAAPPARVAEALPQPDTKKPIASGSKLSDRDAMQGLWVNEKLNVIGKQLTEGELKEANEMTGRMQILVSGDKWWTMGTGPNGVLGTAVAQLAVIDETKNPKWLDLRVWPVTSHGSHWRCIYELDGDVLRICMCAGDHTSTRPAEFEADPGTSLMVMTFRRGKLPPAVGEKSLVGSWIGEPPAGDSSTVRPRVEILDSYLFVTNPKTGHWVGGRYRYDATKNPKWVDVELTTAIEDGKVTKLYGSYEVTDRGLKLALGATGKRALRPLELDARSDVMFFNVKAAKGPPAVQTGTPEKVITAPVPRAMSHVIEEDEHIQTLMKTGDFGGAEAFIRKRLADYKGLERAARDVQLGICINQRAAKSNSVEEAARLFTEATACFREAITEVDTHEKVGGVDKRSTVDKRATWVRTQAELHCLSAFLRAKKPDEVITAAGPMLERYKGTVEELVILSLTYHAHSNKGDRARSQKTLDQMKTVFEKLKDKPGAFPGTVDEHSRAYWEKIWFANDLTVPGALP